MLLPLPLPHSTQIARGSELVLQCTANVTVLHIKKDLSLRTGIPTLDIELCIGQEPLEDGFRLINHGGAPFFLFNRNEPSNEPDGSDGLEARKIIRDEDIDWSLYSQWVLSEACCSCGSGCQLALGDFVNLVNVVFIFSAMFNGISHNSVWLASDHFRHSHKCHYKQFFCENMHANPESLPPGPPLVLYYLRNSVVVLCKYLQVRHMVWFSLRPTYLAHRTSVCDNVGAMYNEVMILTMSWDRWDW